MDTELPAPLLRLKVLIWIHAAIGAALLVGLPAVALATDHKELAIGVLPGLFIWSFGFAPLRKKVDELAPEDRASPRGLPPWILCLLAMGGFLSPLWLAAPLGEWVGAAWLLLGVTVALRWMISRRLSIAVHRPTWGLILGGLLGGMFFVFLLFVILVGSMGA
jgi:hypothetical protein